MGNSDMGLLLFIIYFEVLFDSLVEVGVDGVGVQSVQNQLQSRLAGSFFKLITVCSTAVTKTCNMFELFAGGN